MVTQKFLSLRPPIPSLCGTDWYFYCEKSFSRLFPAVYTRFRVCFPPAKTIHSERKNSPYEKNSLSPGLEPITCLLEGYKCNYCCRLYR